MNVKLTGIAVITAMAFSFAGCDNGKKDNSSLLLLMAKSRMAAQAKATAVSSSVSGSLSPAVTTGGLTAFNKTMDQQKMMIAILNNGNDPVFAKEAAAEYIALQRLEKASPKVQLAAITKTVETSGSIKTYTFSGDIPGAEATITTFSIPMFCSIQINTPTGNPRGTLTFANNSTLVWDGSIDTDPSNFTGSCTMSTVLTYDDFGFFYVDYLPIIRLIKSPMPSMGSICKAANSFAKYGVISSGAVTAILNANYASSNSTQSFTSSANFQINLDSPDGIVMLPNGTGDPVTLILEGVAYSYTSNITVTQAEDIMDPISGSLNVSFTGTVNGNSIDETIAINL